MTRLLLTLLLFAAAPVAAQSATDYYHTAARLYIGEQNPQAEAAAEAGLALDPTDRKLQALLEKIRERQQQQQGGEQEQNDADQQQPGEGEPQAGGADSAEQPPSSEQRPEERGERQPSEEQRPEDEPPRDEREGDVGSEGETQPSDPHSGDGTATPFEVKPGEMSRDEAERILRAIQTDELELLRDVQRRRARPRYVEKDW